MNIAILGTGYVGLVSGTCFAELGANVTCVDIDQKKIESLEKEIISIYGPGFDDMALRNHRAGRLSFGADLSSVLNDVIDSLTMGFYQVGISILDFLSREMDILIISASFSLNFLGAYTLCKQIVFRLYSLLNPIINKTLTPTLALLQDDIQMLKNKYFRVLEFISIINLPLYFLICLCAKEILIILYRYDYAEFSYILIFSALIYGVQSLGNPVGSLIVATGRTDLGFNWTISRIVITFIVLYLSSHFYTCLFLPSLLVLNIFNTFSSWYMIYRKLKNITYIVFWKSVYKPIFIGGSILLPLMLVKNSVNFYVSILLKVSIFIITYILLHSIFNKRHFVMFYNKVKSIAFFNKKIK